VDATPQPSLLPLHLAEDHHAELLLPLLQLPQLQENLLPLRSRRNLTKPRTKKKMKRTRMKLKKLLNPLSNLLRRNPRNLRMTLPLRKSRMLPRRLPRRLRKPPPRPPKLLIPPRLPPRSRRLVLMLPRPVLKPEPLLPELLELPVPPEVKPLLKEPPPQLPHQPRNEIFDYNEIVRYYYKMSKPRNPLK
jgi:hypothetical protein